MDEPNKTAATEPETRPEAAKLQDAPSRRVGSLTLGACLIAAGIFFLCYYFVPGFDWQLVVRIAPAAALVLLGCEVLFFAARPGRWKYDFVSVLVCLGLIAVCMCLSFLPMVWSEIDPARGQNEMKLSKAYTTQVYEALRKENPDLRLRDVYTDLYLYANSVDDLQELQPGDGHLSLTVMLYGPYDSTEPLRRTAAAWPVRCGLAPCSRMNCASCGRRTTTRARAWIPVLCSVWNSTRWNWTARCSWTGPRMRWNGRSKCSICWTKKMSRKRTLRPAKRPSQRRLHKN